MFVDDIQMGRDAGVTTVAVLTGIGSREDLKEADHIIERSGVKLIRNLFYICLRRMQSSVELFL